MFVNMAWLDPEFKKWFGGNVMINETLLGKLDAIWYDVTRTAKMKVAA